MSYRSSSPVHRRDYSPSSRSERRGGGGGRRGPSPTRSERGGGYYRNQSPDRYIRIRPLKRMCHKSRARNCLPFATRRVAPPCSSHPSRAPLMLILNATLFSHFGGGGGNKISNVWREGTERYNCRCKFRPLIQ